MEKKQILYILASKEMIKKDYYKVGGIASSKNMKSRLCTYNCGTIPGFNDNQFLATFTCYNFYEIERELKIILKDFRIENSEVYQIDIKELIKYIEQLIEKKEMIEMIKNKNILKVEKNYPKVDEGLSITNFIKNPEEWIYIFFNKHFKKVDNDQFIKLKDIYQIFRITDVFTQFTSKQKRKYNQNYFYNFFSKDEYFRKFYYDRKKPKNESKQIRNILIGFSLKSE